VDFVSHGHLFLGWCWHLNAVLVADSCLNLLYARPDACMAAREEWADKHMISLKKYLDAKNAPVAAGTPLEAADLLGVSQAAFGAALVQMGYSSLDACPGVGHELGQQLADQAKAFSPAMEKSDMAARDVEIRRLIQQWGQQAARHYQDKSEEVKELLIAMVSAAESAGSRDQRCAGQIHDVTTRLRAVASLDDLTQIRAKIESTAAELKTSIDRMTAEGKQAMDSLRKQVNSYQTKLEAAEEKALRDPLTGVRNRLCVEKLIERNIKAKKNFCVAIIDVDHFKLVNDTHGHLVGDQLLKQFAQEMIQACRSTDVVGRWGGDEFILVLEMELADAKTQLERLNKWVCGNYQLEGPSGPLALEVRASMGLAFYQPGLTMAKLLESADEAMYKDKAASRAAR